MQVGCCGWGKNINEGYLGNHHTGRPFLGLFTPSLQMVEKVQSHPENQCVWSRSNVLTY